MATYEVARAFDPRGKTAVVTGGAAGLGRAVAERLAAAGAHVVIVDIDVERGRAAAAELDGTFVEGDVGQAECWTQIAADHAPQLAVFNAGIAGRVEDVTEISDARYRRIMSINVDQSVFGLRALVPGMRRQGGGSVLIVGSAVGLAPLAGVRMPTYYLTKHAVVGLTRAVAPDLIADQITLNSFNPGLMDTPMGAVRVNSFRAADRADEVLQPARAASVIHDIMIGRGTGRCVLLIAGHEPIDVDPLEVAGWQN